MTQNFSVITAKSVEGIINNNHQAIYDIIKKTYIAHHKKDTVNPSSYFIWYPDKPLSRIIALPALISNENKIAGIKWISSNPENINNGLNRASAVVILNDYETGYPLACIEGSLISAVRTAYSAVLVADHLIKDKKVNTIGVVGTGRIAFNIIKCLSNQNWSAENIILYDKVTRNAENFSNQLKSKNITLTSDIRVENELDKLIQNSDLLIFTTTGKTPYVNKYNLIKKNAVLLNISLRDISPDIIEQSSNIVDDVEHIMNANTSPHLAQQKYNHSRFITATIGELIINSIDFDIKPIIVSPMGLGILDIALAKFIYEEAQNQEENIVIKDFY